MIRIIKLVNGTEVVGDIVFENNHVLEVENPVQINYKNIEAPIPSVSLTRYIQFSKTKKCTFEKHNVMHVIVPLEGLESYYNTALFHFEQEIDQTINRELIKVSMNEEDQDEQYLALLERISTNQPLN